VSEVFDITCTAVVGMVAGAAIVPAEERRKLWYLFSLCMLRTTAFGAF
jgi:hypothetical protein